MSNRTTAIEKIANVCEDNPLVRALAQLALTPIPYGIGSAIDDALTSAVENMREKRLRAFFDELGSSRLQLTEELIQEEDFLHAYFSTLRAAINSRRTQKIRLFAQLLANAGQAQAVGTDAYEEFLNILDDLSLRELRILLILKGFEDTRPAMATSTGGTGDAENELQRVNQFWQSFEEAVNQELGIAPEMLRAILARLSRTGLYETIIGTFFDYTGGRGRLTPLFQSFVEWLDTEEAVLD